MQMQKKSWILFQGISSPCPKPDDVFLREKNTFALFILNFLLFFARLLYTFSEDHKDKKI